MDLLKSIGHPDEIFALLKYKIYSKQSHEGWRSDAMERCYKYLNATSRSFALIIQRLDCEIRDVVCIYYMVLRALDTVEDDMTIDDVTKIPMLTSFHRNLYDASWNFTDSHENDKIVLENFTDISSEFRALKPVYRDIIAITCRKMGHGMAIFVHKRIKTFDDWNLYCHYVAGLVGLGLSDIFSASGLESEAVAEDKNSANSMGLFLQKTNIIRDFLEDSEQARHFWPEEVWTKFRVKTPSGLAALPCLNHLITDALSHVGDVIKYLERVNNPSVFSFCAVPQVMAIATLEKCYNNAGVFEGCVKIRRGESLSLMAQATSLESVKAIFRRYILKIQFKIPAFDPSAMATFSTVENILKLTRSNTKHSNGIHSMADVANLKNAYYPLYVSFVLLMVAIFWNYWLKHFGSSAI